MTFEGLSSEVASYSSVDSAFEVADIEQGLGDIICQIMQEDGSSSMTLAELVYKFSDIAEISCSYNGRSYKVMFDNSGGKIPKIEIHDIATGEAWLVILKHRLFKTLYPQIASKLRLAAMGDKVGIARVGIRGCVLRTFGIITGELGVDLNDTMSPEQMSEFLGERLFYPQRKSPHLKYIRL